jgi:hypothetical protein
MRAKSTRRFLYYQLIILAIFLTLTLLNEAMDMPSHLFGDPPTNFLQRRGEVAVEVAIAVLVCLLQIAFVQKLRREIRILEGFIPICAHCKKIRDFEEWAPLEQYIRDHTLADFTHSICPDCLRKLYPDIAEGILSRSKPSAPRA